MRALQVAVVAALLLLSTCPPDVDTTFVTDNDEIAATPSRLSELVTLLRVVVGQLGQKRFGTLRSRTIGTSRHLFLEDVCAAPDLAAGALMDFLRSNPLRERETPDVQVASLDPRTRILVPWLLDAPGRLTRLLAIVDPVPPPELFRVRLLSLKLPPS
jgi:hypothetical protein